MSYGEYSKSGGYDYSPFKFQFRGRSSAKALIFANTHTDTNTQKPTHTHRHQSVFHLPKVPILCPALHVSRGKAIIWLLWWLSGEEHACQCKR